MKYAAALTLYNPYSDIVAKIESYCKLFEIVIVNDNSTRQDLPYIAKLKENPSVIYVGDGINYGLPIAFNKSLELCYKQSIDYLCTLDQDSVLTEDVFIKVTSYIESNDMRNTAIVAANPVNKWEKRAMNIEKIVAKEVKWVICSGSFLNLDLIKKYEISYDEAYFVDRFDADFSKQIFEKGLKQYIINDAVLQHSCGTEEGHSILRNYYMFRNRFYYNRKYYNKLTSTFRTILQTVRQVYDLIANRTEGWNKVRTLPIAYDDYRKNKLGEISKESLKRIKSISES